jgi:hypothetical protein
MDDTKNGEEMERLRDLTLQKIGRNCVNFANMEQMLRLMRQTSFVHQLRRHQVRQRPGSGSRCRSLRAGPFETNGEASCAALCENETSFSTGAWQSGTHTPRKAAVLSAQNSTSSGNGCGSHMSI